MNVTQAVTDKRTKLLTGQQSQNTAFRNIGTNVAYLSDTSDVTTTAFPVFPGDVVTWAPRKQCYAICGSGLATLLVISDSLGDTTGLGGVVLQPGTQVALQAGTAVGINGNVPVQGTLAGQTVTPGATMSAVSVASNGTTSPLTTTVIPSSSTQRIELHACTFTTTGSGAGPNQGRLVRSDTGADLVIPQSVAPAGSVSVTKDFQGVLLPVNVAVQSIATTPAFGQTSTVAADITYNMVT